MGSAVIQDVWRDLEKLSSQFVLGHKWQEAGGWLCAPEACADLPSYQSHYQDSCVFTPR